MSENGINLKSSMNSKSASAPELYVRSAETQTDPKQTKKNTRTSTTVQVEDNNASYISSIYTPYLAQEESRLHPDRPSRLAFLSYVYVLLGIQVVLSTLQWLCANYRLRPQLNGPARSFYVLLLLLAWLNLSLAFFGFRRLQSTYPLNWIVFACMFETLTLLVMCLCVLELSWYFIAVSVAMLFVYVPLAFWVPAHLTMNLWILIFISISVLFTSALALITSLSMHVYLPLTLCATLFGPWTMYNAYKLHVTASDYYSRLSYLGHAAKMYITFGCTVGGLVVVSRIAVTSIDSENCQAVVFCHRRPDT